MRRLAVSAAVALPTALYLLSAWASHARHYKVGTARQTVLPLSALAVIVCTFLGLWWTILAAGVLAAVTVTVGVVFTARAHNTHDAHETRQARETREAHNTHDVHDS